ncbi:MAG: type I methionyl aminopeptidase [Deltaproteobacteria bacterium]|nr:type I methionyl aminopeptidase [Deltaproteobacteria bacterium]
MREAGRVVHEVLCKLACAAQPGNTTLELDRLAEDVARKRRARPAFKGYLGFPRSLCASINHEVVHGIPLGNRILAEGDLLKLDFGAVVDGFYGDAAVTVAVGKISRAARRLLEATSEALDAAIAHARAGSRVSDLAAAVQGHVEPRGYSVVREFVGHGIGRALHEPPQVPNFRCAGGADPRLEVGMVLAIEPMVNAGGWKTEVLADRWTAVTADRSLSAHFEHSVAITAAGPEILTAE